MASENLTPSQILEKEGIYSLDRDISTMTLEELQEYFAAASSGKIIVSRVIKNIIWQRYLAIRSGEDDFEGNLRSFWYRNVKPVMGRVGALDNPTDPYELMIDAFAEFVQDYRLFKYQEFHFDDDTWEDRRIGQAHPNRIIFAEKRGYMKLLREFYDLYDVTVVALGGQPSILSSEYTVSHITQKVSLSMPFFLYSIVDYDPSGAIIIETYLRQLATQGITDLRLVNLIALKNYSPEEIELYKYPLPTSKSAMTINQKWLELGGGIAGEMFGLEADSMPRDRLRALVRSELGGLD